MVSFGLAPVSVVASVGVLVVVALVPALVVKSASILVSLSRLLLLVVEVTGDVVSFDPALALVAESVGVLVAVALLPAVAVMSAGVLTTLERSLSFLFKSAVMFVAASLFPVLVVKTAVLQTVVSTTDLLIRTSGLIGIVSFAALSRTRGFDPPSLIHGTKSTVTLWSWYFIFTAIAGPLILLQYSHDVMTPEEKYHQCIQIIPVHLHVGPVVQHTELSSFMRYTH